MILAKNQFTILAIDPRCLIVSLATNVPIGTLRRRNEMFVYAEKPNSASLAASELTRIQRACIHFVGGAKSKMQTFPTTGCGL